MSLRFWERSRYPATCQACPKKIEAGEGRYEDKDTKTVLCRECGLKVVSGGAPAPSPAPNGAPPPAPKAPGGDWKAPPAAPAPEPAPKDVPKAEKAPGFDLSTLPRVSLGLTIGLPGYSSAKACLEATADPGEGIEAFRERLERDLLAQLARQVVIALAASKDPAAFVREYGDPADPVVASATSGT